MASIKYFAVTMHWIEETAHHVWKQESALVGFTKMNTAHDGIHLRRALFHVVRRVGVLHKVFIRVVSCTVLISDVPD